MSEQSQPSAEHQEAAQQLPIDSVLKSLQSDKDEFFRLIDEANRAAIKRASPEKLDSGQISAIVSDQEKQDLNMGYSKGPNLEYTPALQYWIRRLLSEVNILPPSIAEAVRAFDNAMRQDNMPTGKALKELFSMRKELAEYIDFRRESLKFNVAKRLEMAKLKQHLYEIDNQGDGSEENLEGGREVFYDSEHGQTFIRVGDEVKPISIGDIVADYDWGIRYKISQDFPPQLLRKTKKLVALTAARRGVEKIFNFELLKIEGVLQGAGEYMDADRIEEKLVRHKGKRLVEATIEGVLAEKMVQGFLIRVQHNNPDLGLKVEAANALEDTELKYDFKILIPDKTRGVAIKGDDLPRDQYVQQKKEIGFQLTVSKKVGKKRRQIREAKLDLQKYNNLIKRPVDDIVLLSLPLKTYGQHFMKWFQTGKSSGGPEQFLTRKEKVRILKIATNNFLALTDAEIEKLNL